jgi:ribonuclease R
LIKSHGWGDDGLSVDEIDRLDETAKHISETERRSMVAERDTTDRYLAAYLSERVGNEFSGRISGIAKFGAFVRMDETGADGLVPVRSLGREFFHFDREAGTLQGSDSGFTIGIGQRVTVRLAQATPVTGGLELELLSVEDRALPQGRGQSRRRGGPAGRTAAKSRNKKDKLKRKLVRKKRD